MRDVIVRAQAERGVRRIRESLELLQDLPNIQIAQCHQSEHGFRPLAFRVLRVVLRVRTKSNTLLHTMKENFHQKVKDARISETGYRECVRECIEECLQECFRGDFREGLGRVFDYVVVSGRKASYTCFPPNHLTKPKGKQVIVILQARKSGLNHSGCA